MSKNHRSSSSDHPGSPGGETARYWVSGFFGFGFGFTRNPFIFIGFLFLETIPTRSSDPAHFLGFFGGFDQVLWVNPTHEHP